MASSGNRVVTLRNFEFAAIGLACALTLAGCQFQSFGSTGATTFSSSAGTVAGASGGAGGSSPNPTASGNPSGNSGPAFVATGMALNAKTISAGASHVCAITSQGSVSCWGINLDGELGAGNTSISEDSTLPLTVTGLSGITQVAAGGNHTCALTTQGTVFCWGSNIDGELGNNSQAVQSTVPVEVSGLTGITAITSGDNYSCALTQQGTVMCWGYNGEGELGNNSTTNSSVPVAVQGLSGITALSAGGGYLSDDGFGGNGEGHTCALTQQGTVMCWGYNGDGELGNNSTTDSTVPVAVSALSGVTAVVVGQRHTCALTQLGTVMCWGYNFLGALGNNSDVNSSVPVAVSGLSGVVAISAGADHSCALTQQGTVSCWGSNQYGQVENINRADSLIPVAVTGLSGVTAIASGKDYNCALTGQGAISCWGFDEYGQLGNSSAIQSEFPIANGNLSNVSAIAAGAGDTCALSQKGTVSCWGFNSQGELGIAATNFADVPMPVSGLSGITQISAGEGYRCALSQLGTVFCWGDNFYGELGNNPQQLNASTVPVPVSGLSGAISIASGGYDTCALTRQGTVMCWGDNQNGELGNGSTAKSPTPVEVSGLTGVKAISLGSAMDGPGTGYACALTQQGTVFCWGYNQHGELGNNSTTDSSTPVAVSGLTGVTSIAAGGAHTCAVTQQGSVYCWGDDEFQELGNISPTNSAVPIEVKGLSGVLSITAGQYETCALTQQGAVLCWGCNMSGEMGLGPALYGSAVITPTAMTDVTKKIASIYASPIRGVTYLIYADGTVAGSGWLSANFIGSPIPVGPVSVGP